ncbi:MarR family winged helix-turn-helix transcriptional regulator [Kribbella sp. NBC_01484]|uniref:MarR family winged helix-turn-helix transcriptional regulator n=1 Tax=Kribbella sp. NBC_01484 TaxID=2903579 RepID=UPI003FA5BCC3
MRLMSAISDGDLAVAAIARRLGLPRQAVHRVVDDLVAQAHVQKLPNPDHARTELISLTDAGRAVLHQLWCESDRHRLELVRTAELCHRDLATACEALERLPAPFQQPR